MERHDDHEAGPINIFKILEERIEFPDVPYGDFDPLTATDEELRTRKLPPRPPPSLPEACANWVRLMSRPLKIIDPARVEQYFSLSPKARQRVAMVTSAGVRESSSNWSGAFLRADMDQFCSIVQGSWPVPRPSRPSHAPHDGEWYSSAWIGFDGHEPASLTAPQLGTQQIVRVAGSAVTVTIHAWWQWWLRDKGFNDQVNLPLSVLPGEIVSTMITVLDPIHANFFFKNMTTGQASAFDACAPSLPRLGPEPIEAETTEWIFERQTNPYTLELRPFNDFHHCHFFDCNATFVAADGSCSEAGLQDSRQIQLVAWDDPHDPGRVLSEPRPLTSSHKLELHYVPPP